MFACLHAPGNLALLIKCASHFSPHLEETSSSTVIFDVGGLRRLYGTPEQIAAEIQRRVGIPANLAIASNPDAALFAAQGIKGVTIMQPGREAMVLAPLAPYLLGGSAEFAQALDRWGIRTLGEFAELPPLGVAARLGDEGTYLQSLARGQGKRQLRLRVDPLEFREEKELEDSIHLLEPLMLVMEEMLGDLCERLRFHGRAANELSLRMKLERGKVHTAKLRLPVAMLDTKVLLKLLQLEFNERPPIAPVEKIWIEMTPAEARTTQHGLFLPAAPEPEKLEITLTRIRGLVGSGNAGAPRVVDTHRPDMFEMEVLRAHFGTAKPPAAKLAFRRFRPPCPANVWRSNEGKPVRLSSSRGGGDVVACAGPWESSGDWWSAEAWKRQEWDVEISSMGVSRIYQDYLKGRWFIEGNYD